MISESSLQTHFLTITLEKKNNTKDTNAISKKTEHTSSQFLLKPPRKSITSGPLLSIHLANTGYRPRHKLVAIANTKGSQRQNEGSDNEARMPPAVHTQLQTS